MDRLRPRGLSKEKARLDVWRKDLAAAHLRVTLLYGARDPEVNHAQVLLEFIQRHP